MKKRTGVMGTLTGGLIAFVAGLAMAGATVVGVVQSQQSPDNAPVTATTVSYGSND